MATSKNTKKIVNNMNNNFRSIEKSKKMMWIGGFFGHSKTRSTIKKKMKG